MLHDQFTEGIQGRAKVHFAERNLSLFSDFMGVAERLTAWSLRTVSRYAGRSKSYVLLFEQNTESWGNQSSRFFCTTLQRLQKLTDSLLLKQEFVQVRQSCSESVSNIYRLRIHLHGGSSDEWSDFFCCGFAIGTKDVHLREPVELS